MSVFEVRIDRHGEAGGFRVDVLSSPDGGAASAVVRLDVDTLLASRRELEQAVLISAIPTRKMSAEEQRVRDVGQVLFEALLGTGEVAGRYRAAMAVAAERGEGLRVVLRIADPALAALPWEAMYDSARGSYVCRREHLVRHIDVLARVSPLAVDLPLRILGIVSSPRGLPMLDAGKEKEQLTDALGELSADGLAELAWARAATWAALQDVLRRGTWHVVHYIGHGSFDLDSDEGLLALTREDGRPHMVEASRFIDLLLTARPMPRLVVLNSCSGGAGSADDMFAGTAAALVRGGFGAVTAMQYSISDPAAIEFSRGLYGAIAAGRGVDEAVTDGRTAILGLSGRTLEWVTPVLYLRGADSKLFTINAASRSAPGTAGAAGAAGAPGTPRTRPAAIARLSRMIRTISAHAGGVASVAFSPDGKLIASAGVSDRTVRLWTPVSGQETRSFTVGDGRVNRFVSSVAFSPDGVLLASGWSDGTVRLFPVGGGALPADMRDQVRDQADADEDERDFPLSERDIDLLLDEICRLFSSEERAHSFLRNIRFPARLIPSWSSDAYEFWGRVFEDLGNGAMAMPYRRMIGRALRLYGANRVLEDLERRYGAGGVAVPAATQARVLDGHAGRVRAVAFSPDGTVLASAGDDGAVLLRALTAVASPVSLPRQHDYVRALAFSPDGAVLATAGSAGVVCLWSVADQRPIHSPPDHLTQVNAVAFSPDERLIAAAAADGSVRLWDMVTHDQLPMHGAADRTQWSVAFSPDGELIASGSAHVTLWNVATRKPVGRLTAHYGPVKSVAFSPDGKLLASAGGDDGTIRLWE